MALRLIRQPFGTIYRSAANQFQSVLHVRYNSDGIKREDLPVSRFPVPEQNTLPKDVQERMKTIEEKSGFLPNVFKALSYHPKEFECFFKYYDVLMEENTGSLTKAEKELIVVATSAKNHCLYCVVAHSAVHRIYSKNPYVADQVATSLDFSDLTPRERAIAEYAVKVSQMETISPEDYTALESHGLSDDDVWFIGAVAAFFAMSNRLAHMSAMRPNEEFYAMGRVKKEKEKLNKGKKVIE